MFYTCSSPLLSLATARIACLLVGMTTGSLLTVICLSCDRGNDSALEMATDEQIIQIVQKMPKEEILDESEIVRRIRDVDVYISLTTSPTRIKYLGHVLQTLDTSLIKAVLLILPERFIRDGSAYEIPDHIANFPKLKIIRITRDLGPISKLLGLFELDNISEGREIAQEVLQNPKNRIITIDDDQGYPIGTVSQLIKKSLLADRPAVFAASAADVSRWGINRNMGWPDTINNAGSTCEEGEQSYCDVVEGFSGIIYWVGSVIDSKNNMLRLAAHSKSNLDCFFSDDLVISYSLARQGIPRFKVANRFIRRSVPFKYGLAADALHRGAGVGKEVAPSDINFTKYPKCFQHINEIH